jgi:basic membrane lipoprotein Med (substrate-binding protein (PBP1-ABC) superfamily)
MIKNHNEGKLGGETYVLHLENGGLQIIYNSGFSLPDDVKKAGDAAIEGIKSGTIKVNP